MNIQLPLPEGFKDPAVKAWADALLQQLLAYDPRVANPAPPAPSAETDSSLAMAFAESATDANAQQSAENLAEHVAATHPHPNAGYVTQAELFPYVTNVIPAGVELTVPEDRGLLITDRGLSVIGSVLVLGELYGI